MNEVEQLHLEIKEITNQLFLENEEKLILEAVIHSNLSDKVTQDIKDAAIVLRANVVTRQSDLSSRLESLNSTLRHKEEFLQNVCK
jgi:hypothetical protein